MKVHMVSYNFGQTYFSKSTLHILPIYEQTYEPQNCYSGHRDIVTGLHQVLVANLTKGVGRLCPLYTEVWKA